jgi:hypothetical protein
MKKVAVFFLLTFCLSAFCQQPGKNVRFFKPNFGWAVEMPFHGFSIIEAKQYDKDSFKVRAFDERREIFVEIYFESGAPNVDSKKVRLFYESNQNRSKIKKENVKKWEADSAAYLIYNSKEILVDPKGDELNGDMYFSKGSTWVDVRFRKPYFKEGDEKVIKNILQSVKIIGGFEPSTEDNVFMGNLYCISGFSDNCLTCLGRAFDSEKKAPALSREIRISLCENYANALRLKGERNRATVVLDFGLAFDKYPMYYWTMARIYGDLGDEDNAVEMLAAAVENRKDLLPGEKLPDPRQDESFKVLGMKESFRAKITKIFTTAKPKDTPKPEEKKADK